MSTDSRKALQHFFGYDAFLDNQESIIDDILAGNDLCVIMPTGAGKSLCYQLPALMRHSFTIVESWLNAIPRSSKPPLFRSRTAFRKRWKTCRRSELPAWRIDSCKS